MNTSLRLKTAQAAEVAGVGYEGFRSWLKRGLLKDTGILPKSYASHVEAEVTDAKRWRWSAFGFADLCCFRLTKLMLDAGLSWHMAAGVAGDQRLWQSFKAPMSDMRYVAAFPEPNQYTLYPAEDLSKDLASGIVKHDWMTIFDLHELKKNVVWRSRAVLLRLVAVDMANTSSIFVTSGPNMLTPIDATARQRTIEQLAQQIETLAGEAQQGGGSYQEFEAILGDLHKQGKFPHNEAVSAVAFAFSD